MSESRFSRVGLLSCLGGAALGALGLIGWQRDYWTWWFPVLVFSPFIVDASVTLARRGLRRCGRGNGGRHQGDGGQLQTVHG